MNLSVSHWHGKIFSIRMNQMIMHGKEDFFHCFSAHLRLSKRVLNNISQIGAFLVRPQSKQTNPNTQDYVSRILSSFKEGFPPSFRH